MHIETLKVFCDMVDLQSFSLAAERNFGPDRRPGKRIRLLASKYERLRTNSNAAFSNAFADVGT